MTRIAFQTGLRAACVSLLETYAAAAGIKLQVYPGRPATLYPPTAFPDRIDETIDYTNALRQRHPTAQIVVVWGTFDSAETVAQRDAFVDAWLDAVTDDADAANAATLIQLNRIDDEPTFIADWLPPERQVPYYATRFSIEGLALEGD